MSCRYIVGDVLDILRSMPDASVDLVLSSPPFLALRSYLPADHPDKAKEIGSEPTPGAYIDTLLDVVEECRRVLAPHGSLCFELGDTYAGSGGAGGDYAADGLRVGQPKFRASTPRWDRRPEGQTRTTTWPDRDAAPQPTRERYRTRPDGNGKVGRGGERQADHKGAGWPLDKSLCLIPEPLRVAMVYGFNPLTGRTTPRWRARNVVRWHRPNPPVGALGDKFRPSTSDLLVACVGGKRYFDLDAVRGPGSANTHARTAKGVESRLSSGKSADDAGRGGNFSSLDTIHETNGAPPLDTWIIPTEPYRGVVPGDTLYRASPDCPEHSLRAIRQRLQTAPSGELREALLRNSRRIGGDRAVARACALHARSDLESTTVRLAMQDWLDRSIQSEQTTGSTAASKTPAIHRLLDRGPDQPDAGAKTPVHTSRTTTPSTMPDRKSEQMPLERGGVATRHSTASNRTDPVPATTLAGTPSAQTADCTADMSAPPESSERRPDMPASSTSGACPSVAVPGSPARIAGKSSACPCEQFTELISHYATWPTDLLIKPILSMCPARVCTTCGRPSERIVERLNAVGAGTVRSRQPGHERQHLSTHVPDVAEHLTTGWTDCGCPGDHWRNGLVLDPFGGSGTTGVVALGHGRDAILIDLDRRNADLARDRVGMWLTVEHHGASEVPA